MILSEEISETTFLEEERQYEHPATILLSEIISVNESVYEGYTDVTLRCGVTETVKGNYNQVRAIWVQALKFAQVYKLN